LELGGFRVRTPDHIYWIAPGTPSVRTELASRRIESLCVGLDRPGGVPPEDVAITLLSWIRSDPITASATANTTFIRTVPEDAGEDALVRTMAMAGARRRSRNRLPDAQRLPGPVLSDAERRGTLAMLERIRTQVEWRMAGGSASGRFATRLRDVARGQRARSKTDTVPSFEACGAVFEPRFSIPALRVSAIASFGRNWAKVGHKSGRLSGSGGPP
jgi:hypothetical protein